MPICNHEKTIKYYNMSNDAKIYGLPRMFFVCTKCKKAFIIEYKQVTVEFANNKR